MSACMFLSPGLSSTGKPDRNCGGAYVVPLIISIPSMIRLRQCLIEYLRVRKHPNKDAVTGWGGWATHLWHPIEYTADKIMQTTSSKCFEVFQCLPSHYSKCSSARDRPKVHRNERSRSFSTLVHHDVQNPMILLLTDVQVVLRLHEFILLLLLGRCQST